MAVYTALDKGALDELIDDYGLVRLTASHAVTTGSVNSNYVLETPRGKHLLRIDEVKGELDVKRELDLLLFLRKQGFPCPQPVADRKHDLGETARQVDPGTPAQQKKPIDRSEGQYESSFHCFPPYVFLTHLWNPGWRGLPAKPLP